MIGVVRMARVMAFAVALVAGGPALADDLAMDLSSHQISITSSFTGTDILVFGAIQTEGEGQRDLVIVLRGPDQRVMVRRKEPVFGVWLNLDSQTFSTTPGYYAIASTRPLDEIAPPGVMGLYQIGLDVLRLDEALPTGGVAEPDVAVYRAALMRIRVANGLFTAGVPIGRIGPSLFRAEFDLPSNVPVGNYRAEVYLLRDGRVINAQVSPLFIDKSGLDRAINVAATNYAALYGLVAVLIAALAGWLADFVFRRR